MNSGAAVKITAGAITAMQREPQIDRAEALRRSVSALIAKGNGWDHPSIRAPDIRSPQFGKSTAANKG